MGTGKRRRRLGLLLTSCLPTLTPPPLDPPQPPAGVPHRTPVPASPPSPPPPASSTASPPSRTSSTVPSMTTATARFSEESKTSSRFETATSSPLSFVEPSDGTPCFEDAALPPPSTPPKAQKIPDAPTWTPPQPPAPVGDAAAMVGTPQRGLPAVTATHPTPPNRSRADRSPSPDHPASRAKLQPHHLHPGNHTRGRSVSAQAPAVRGVSADPPRIVSNPLYGQGPPSHASSEGSPPTIAADKKKPRKSWFPGARSRANSDAAKPRPQGAWILAGDHPIDYNTAPLVNGEKVPELWNEAGNVYVYVHPKESGRGPCFKVADHIFSNSPVLVELLVTEMMASTQLDAAPQAGPVTEGHLYLPLGNTDLERLVAARNLFAFLTHQPLVTTSESPTLFAAILQMAGLLRRFNFSNFDGSSFGELVDTAFDVLTESTGIADVRQSCEKTLEALILAEQMKSWNLYNEAFAHAVGKYEAILDLKSPLFDRISVSTRQRLDRAHLDLVNRQANVSTRLEAFEFPSLFSGIANSTSTEEYRNIRFKEWRNSFGKMRSFVLGYYKTLFGHWPPRARSKKNYFSQSGLNRQCLKILYSDFCALYDLLVDRQSLTPRVIGENEEKSTDQKKEKDGDQNSGQQDDRKLAEASISALRKMLGEFDNSSPPVLPPIPFDVPKLPSMTAIYENYHDLPAKKQAKYSKALQPHEIQLILIKSRNLDTDALNMPFLAAYKEFELREARSANPSELLEQRVGHWLFLYVVLQSLPMLVVDAPGLRYTEGVEYFLCEPPQGNPPWTEDAGATRKMWFQTNNANVVELSADVVMFSVEGIYMRSHCWLAAKEWEANGGAVTGSGSAAAAAALLATGESDSPLQPPQPAFRDMDPYTTGPASATDNNTSSYHRRSQSPSSFQPGSRPNSPGSNAVPSSAIPTSSSITANLPPPVPLPNPTSRPSSPHLRPTAGPAVAPSTSPLLRPRSSSTNDRARQAFRASIAIGLEPLPMNAGLTLSMDRASRVVSVGSGFGSGTSGGGSSGFDGPAGSGSPSSPPPGLFLGGQPQFSPDQLSVPFSGSPGLRTSRSATSLTPLASGAGADYLAYHQQREHMRTSSYGSGFSQFGPASRGGFGHVSHGSLGGSVGHHHHPHLQQHYQSPLSVSTLVGSSSAGSGVSAAGAQGVNDSPVGDSTFDDILKGVEKKEKKRKKLFLI
ncbi:hypothetical protein VTJ49DRAFT_2302 [Mycothermus thermophilus]|uniref:DUF8004 domain-containing protein n=1 Tax=Humicola insolens TaxID=85995 RepID=A0ABR3VI85_HUMIN